MVNIYQRLLNSCLVLLIVIGMFLSLLIITGAMVLILSPHSGGL
jgi:hypothetical protein